MRATSGATPWRHLWGWALSILLVACGGGGGGGPPPSDTISGNFFPLAVGDMWVYTGDAGARAVVRAVGTRTVGGQSGIAVSLEDSQNGTSESTYLVSASGVRQVPTASGDPIEMAIGPIDLLRYPLVAGDSFVQIDRTISTGIDFDGDGRIEPATVHSEVSVIGLETVDTPAGSLAGSLHVRTTIRTTVQLTGRGQSVTVLTTVDDWYAPDIGPVRSTMNNTSEGLSETRTLTASTWHVGSRRSETTPPAVLSLTPTDGSRQGPVASVRVEFNEAVDTSSLAGALTLTGPSGQAIAGTITPGINGLSLDLAAPLTSGRYTARLAPTVTDIVGNALAAARSWSFDIDAEGPQIVAVTPMLGALDVALDTTITVRFDEAVEPGSLTASNVALRSLGNPDAAISVVLAGDTLTVTPTAPLLRAVEYTLVLGTMGYGARDLAGNWAPSSNGARFTTDPGRFGAPQTLEPFSGAEAVAVGDVDGDGRNDVVVAVGHDSVSAQAFHLALYRQQSNGQLAPVQWIPTAATFGCRPTSLAIGDFNGDGRQDVALAEYGCGIEVFLQGSGGALQPGTLLPSAQSFLVRAADFNGDGRIDLVAAGWSDTVVRVWLQSTSGQLVDSATPALENQGWGTMAVGDLDGDGRPDIAVSSGQGSLSKSIGVALQRADSSFSTPLYLAATTPDILQGLAIGDVDGDGRTELVAAIDGRIRRWRVAGGALVDVGSSAIVGNVGPLTLADVNGDGRRDIVIVHGGGGGIGVLLQQTAGSIGAEARYAGYVSGPQPDALAVADVSGDGRPDIVLPRSLLLQRPVAMFAEGVRPPGTGTAATLRRALEAALRR